MRLRRLSTAAFLTAVSLVVLLAAGAPALAVGSLTVSASLVGSAVTISGTTAASANVGIQVDDPQGNVVFVGQDTSDGQGNFGDSFTLSSGAATGTYIVYATAAGGGGGTGNTTFVVQQVQQAVTIASVNSLSGIPVPYETTLADAGLPATVGITLSNGTMPTVGVTWNGGNPAYNGSAAGSYTFTGKPTLPSGVTNPDSLTASVVVTVQNASNTPIGSGSGGGGGTPSPILTLTTTSLPVGTVGQSYNQTIATNNEGTAPYTFSVTSGTLPDGFTLDTQTGAITGTPNTAGTYTFTISVKDANNNSASESYMLMVNAATVAQTPTTPSPSIQPVTLTDIAGNWAYASIEKLVALGAITGYPDGTFRPNNDITRAEFVTVLVKALKLPPESGPVFADTEGNWARSYISTAAADGIVTGFNATHFGPNDPITREQMAAMVVRADKLVPVSGTLSFTDAASIATWALPAVTTAVKDGIVNGYPDGTFRPLAYATRAEAVTVIARLLK